MCEINRVSKGTFSVTSDCTNTSCCCAKGTAQLSESGNTINIVLSEISGNCASNGNTIVVNLSSSTSGSAVYNQQTYQFNIISANKIVLSSSSCSFTFQCISGACSSAFSISISFLLLLVSLFVSIF